MSRQFVKISSLSRAMLYKNIQNNEKLLPRPCFCKFSIPIVTRAYASAPVLSTIDKAKQNDKNPEKKDAAVLAQNQNMILDDRSKKSEELLEKLIVVLSADIHQKNRIYKNDLLRVLARVEEMNFSTKKQGLLLIRCCTELLADESPVGRMALVEKVWNTIKPHTKFDVDHYNELLSVYIANNRTLTVRTFIKQMDPIKPNHLTYELILRALGEAGDINQATETIANMKAQNLSASEDIFNSLIICQGRNGNIQNIQEVLTMMTSLMIEKSIDTYTALARAMAFNKDTDRMFNEINRALESGLRFEEDHIMAIVKTLAISGDYRAIPNVLKFLPEEILKSPSITPYMQSVTTQLVFQNHPMAALEIYKSLPLPSFGPKDDQGLHGRSLVRDCVKAGMPSAIITLITQDLMATGRNPIAIQNASEAALQLGKVPLALDLFLKMKQLGMPLRPHYFWPVLIHLSKSNGEKGTMEALKSMIQMDINPDYETMMNYTLPYVSFTSPQNLMKKFQEAGLSITTALTPMMETLLNMGQVRAASEICELFRGKVDAEKLLKPLQKGYLTSLDSKSTIHILEDISMKAIDKNKDWVGRFLCTFMQHKKVKEDLTDFMNIARELVQTRLRISTSAADFCLGSLPDHSGQAKIDQLRAALLDITDDKLMDESDMFVAQHLHPKHMNEESLKAHLKELEAKGMNTRGILRRLLQEYCKKGKLAEAREIVDKCQKEGVFLSAGMKASIFDLHVKLGELDLAESVLADLNKTAPNFVLDEFKVIDFATLMVYRKKISKAFNLINEQSKKRHIVGGRNISMNCWRLLDALAAQGAVTHTRRMLELLLSLRYTAPTGPVLGPLIRAHLKNDNITEAVNEFVRISEKYNKTPLKHELLCKILRLMSDGLSEENFLTNEKSNGKLNRLAQTILNVVKKVHGPGDVQLTLIAALADVGYKKTLRKTLLDPTVKVHPDALMRRCEWFCEEGKIPALETLAECAKDLRHVDVSEIYDLVLDVYQRNDNCLKAVELYTKMQELGITPTKKFIRNLVGLLQANNKPLPSDLAMHQEKQSEKMTNQ